MKQNSEPGDRYFIEEHPYIPNNPIGIYSSSSSFMHSASLKINEDNTFEYSSKGCTGEDKAKGNWKQISNKIILQSFTKSKKKIYKKTVLEEKVMNKADDKNAKNKLLYEWIQNNTNKSIEFSFIREIEIDNWKLKVGEDFLISEEIRNSTVVMVYKRI